MLPPTNAQDAYLRQSGAGVSRRWNRQPNPPTRTHLLRLSHRREDHTNTDVASRVEFNAGALERAGNTVFGGKCPIRQPLLLIARQRGDVAKGLTVGTALRRVMNAVGLLKEVDDVVNGGIEDFQVGTKIEFQDTAVFQEPALRATRQQPRACVRL